MRRLLFLAALLPLLAGPALAGGGSSLLPDIPKGTGEPHPEGNQYWRLHHMELLRHDRDLTMHEGDRSILASLKGCFDCHAAKDESGKVVTYASEKHFCRSCHDYAAVRVDCFSCHRSTPDGVDEGAASHAWSGGPAQGGPAGARADIEALAAYLAASEGAKDKTRIGVE